MGNRALRRADGAKRDEFYTRLEDIEKELDNYREHFEGKVIYLNCDDPEYSAFWQYFSYNFDSFGLKKLIATYYVSGGGSSYKYEYEHKNDANAPEVTKTKLKGDGDFRSAECVEILKEADIVITNPPFSLWREYVAQLIEYDKKFITLGNVNAITYKEVFPLFKNHEIWFGPSITSGDREFRVPDTYPLKASKYRVDDDGNKYIQVKGVRWYTNLDHNHRHDDLVLTRSYEGDEDRYPKYDNYDAIEVGYTKDIPMDYVGVMGVPITFMDKYSPDQFDIIGMATGRKEFEDPRSWPSKEYGNVIRHNKDGSTANGSYLNNAPVLEISEPLKNKTYYKVDGKMYRAVYARVLIVNKKPKV